MQQRETRGKQWEGEFARRGASGGMQGGACRLQVDVSLISPRASLILMSN